MGEAADPEGLLDDCVLEALLAQAPSELGEPQVGVRLHVADKHVAWWMGAQWVALQAAVFHRGKDCRREHRTRCIHTCTFCRMYASSCCIHFHSTLQLVWLHACLHSRCCCMAPGACTLGLPALPCMPSTCRCCLPTQQVEPLLCKLRGQLLERMAASPHPHATGHAPAGMAGRHLGAATEPDDRAPAAATADAVTAAIQPLVAGAGVAELITETTRVLQAHADAIDWDGSSALQVGMYRIVEMELDRPKPACG